MIRATGLKRGSEVTIEINNGAYMFNGEHNADMEIDFKKLIDEELLVMGSYYPENNPYEDTTYIIGILSEWYFDELKNIEVIGEKVKEMESEKGVLY